MQKTYMWVRYLNQFSVRICISVIIIYWVGLESTCSMGMMSKSVCRAMLKFLAKSLPAGAVEHSLGDSRSNAAYVRAPLLACVDRLNVTPDGEDVPLMRFEFPETIHQRAARKNGQLSMKTHGSAGFDTSSTYSFTIKGKYIDFCEWSTCGFRMMNPTNLATFIGSNASLRLVAFHKPVGVAISSRSVSPTPNPKQTQNSARRAGLEYLFEVDISATDGLRRTSQFLDYNQDSDSDDGERTLDITDELTPTNRSTTPDSSSLQLVSQPNTTSDINIAAPISTHASQAEAATVFSSPIPPPREKVTMDWTSEDLHYCSAFIEIDDYRRFVNTLISFESKPLTIGRM